MRKIIRIVLGTLCCLSFMGCQRGNEDFISQMGQEHKAGFAVTFDAEEEEMPKVIGVEASGNYVKKLLDHFKAAIMQTKYKKYMDPYSLSVNWGGYVKDLLTEEGLSWTGKIWENDYYYENDIDEYQEYHKSRMVQNCLFCVDDEGNIVINAYHVFLTKDRELVNALEQENLGWLVSAFAQYEKELEKNPESFLKNGYAYNQIQTGDIEFLNENSLNVISMDNSGIAKVQIAEGTQWLQEYQAEDAWGISRSSSNKTCDFLEYSYEYDNSLETSCAYSLCVYGQKKSLKEIVFSKDTGREEKVPAELQPTIEKHLMAIGATEVEAEKLLADLPQKDGTQGKLAYLVERKAGRYFYKFFQK